MSAPTEAAPAAKAKRTANVLKRQHPPVEVDGSIFQPWPCPTEILVAGRAWIGRAVRLDIQVESLDGNGPLDVWATILICAKSFMPVGWFIHAGPSSIESLSMAIQAGVERSGRPEHILIDILRNPRPDDLWHADALAAFLGTKIEFKSSNIMTPKAVEREFLSYRFDTIRAWTQFNSEDLKKVAFKKILTAQQFEPFYYAISHIISGLMPHRLLTHGPHCGKSRADVFREDLHKHGHMPTIDATRISQIPSEIGRSKIDRKGASGWWAVWMADRQGESVIVSYDNFDTRIARVYEDAEVGYGKFIGFAEKIHGVAWRTEK